MKSVLLIGLGRFGRHVARKLNEMNHQVLAVDKNEKRVEDALPYLTSAQIGDSTEAVSYTHLDVYKRQIQNISFSESSEKRR